LDKVRTCEGFQFLGIPPKGEPGKWASLLGLTPNVSNF